MYLNDEERKRLKLLMLNKGIAFITEFAKKLGVHPGYISRFYRGHDKCIKMRLKICDFFGIKYSDLFDNP